VKRRSASVAETRALAAASAAHLSTLRSRLGQRENRWQRGSLQDFNSLLAIFPLTIAQRFNAGSRAQEKSQSQQGRKKRIPFAKANGDVKRLSGSCRLTTT
jgi:hypothetical protein